MTMTKKTFLTVVTLCWVCSLVGFVLIFTTRGQLPEELQSYVASRKQPHAEPAWADVVVGWQLLKYLFAALVANVCIYSLRPWARWLYTIVAIAGWLVILPLGHDPVVHTLWVELASGLSSTLSGFALCAMWFVPEVRDLFRSGTESVASPPRL